MATKKVVRPQAKRLADIDNDETSPGDLIELSVTEEVRTSSGSRWVKVGLVSQHRDGETTAEATARIEEFVIESLGAFVNEAVR